MSNTGLELSEATLRQRRNLFLVSGLILFAYVANVEFGDNVKLLWISATIHRPEAVMETLLAMEAYFLWRFYQYFHIDKAFPALKQQYRELLKQRRGQAVQKAILRRNRRIQALTGKYEYGNLNKENAWHYSIDVKATGELRPSEQEFVAKIPVYEIEKECLITPIAFAFRGKILTDFFFPYLFSVVAAGAAIDMLIAKPA